MRVYKYGWWVVGVGGRLLLHQSNSWRSNGLILGGGGRVAPILTYLENYSCFCIAVLVAGGGGRFRSPIYVSSLLLLLQICRELATIFLRDNDNAPIFEKLATTRQATFFRLRDIVALSRKLSRAPSSANT